jgi:hypothetical protein
MLPVKLLLPWVPLCLPQLNPLFSYSHSTEGFALDWSRVTAGRLVTGGCVCFEAAGWLWPSTCLQLAGCMCGSGSHCPRWLSQRAHSWLPGPRSAAC